MYIDWIWQLDVQYVSVMMTFPAQLAEGGGHKIIKRKNGK
jgi:hypothetical protein